MAHLIVNAFSTYHLDDGEQIEGQILTITQAHVIQNMLAASAQEKLALEYDSSEPLLYAQQEAYKRGQIELLQFILDASEAAVESRKEGNTPQADI